MKTPPPIHFAIPVWGSSYTRTYLNYSLPAQLALGNLPSLSEATGCSYTIFTTAEDAKEIRASAAFQCLTLIIATEIRLIGEDQSQESFQRANKYDLKSDCYRHALRRAASEDAALVSLNADIVLADGFINKVVRLLEAGKRVIEVPGPRGLIEPIGNALKSQYFDKTDGSITISATELSALWAQYMHPQLEMHFVEGPDGGPFHPSHLYWPIPGDGAVVRGFHLYPIAVYPRCNGADFTSTIDDDLVGNLAPNPKEVFLAQDSQTLFCCELSPLVHHVGRAVDRGDADQYVEFYLSYARHNFRNLSKEILISGCAPTSPEWTSQRRKSKRFVRSLARRYYSRVYRDAFNEYVEIVSNTLSEMASKGKAVAYRAKLGSIPKLPRKALRRVWHTIWDRKT